METINFQMTGTTAGTTAATAEEVVPDKLASLEKPHTISGAQEAAVELRKTTTQPHGCQSQLSSIYEADDATSMAMTAN
jgi:hypothetical protein